MTEQRKIRAIAFYLPQFHPIPENDEWWGKGFTEWTNTAKAKPLFRGHYQPHLPADLGFYDLRVPETRIAQADMARSAGIEGFCYYHYWFAGKQILERPFQEVLLSGQPDYPFCLCWANESWTGIWHGSPNRVLIEQSYPGDEDHRRHFDVLRPAFLDHRYMRVDNKPILLIYRPNQIPHVRGTMSLWQRMAREIGLPGLHLVGVTSNPTWSPVEYGFDEKMYEPRMKAREWISRRTPIRFLKGKYQRVLGMPTVLSYREWQASGSTVEEMVRDFYPCVVHAWDNTARSGKDGFVIRDAYPERFRTYLQSVLNNFLQNHNREPLIFFKSWNEWAEGNHLEPDQIFGYQYLETIRSEMERANSVLQHFSSGLHRSTTGNGRA